MSKHLKNSHVSTNLSTFRSIFQKHAGFVFGMFIFLLLLTQNPFSPQHSLGNLEPFPDTIYYISSAESLLSGHGFALYREGQIVQSTVPPLYSFFLLPFLAISHDVRIFYVANVVLAVIAAVIFYCIVNDIFPNVFIRDFIFLLYVTTYFTYWYPHFAMSENLVLPIFSAFVLLLLKKVSRRKILLVSLLSISLYATKYSNLPLSILCIALYAGKIMQEHKENKAQKIEELVTLLGTMAVFSLVFVLFDQFILHGSILPNFDLSLINTSFATRAPIVKNGHPDLFSLTYIWPNLKQYAQDFWDGAADVLQTVVPFLPQFVIVCCVPALIVNCFHKDQRFLSINLATLFVGMLLFISSFFIVDFRYVIFFVPLLLIVFGIFLSHLPSYFHSEAAEKLSPFILPVFYLIFIVTVLPSIFTQLNENFFAQNISYDNYYAVQQINNFFVTPTSPQPILLSYLPPYYFDYFSNHRYRILPASSLLYFSDKPEKLYGPDDYTNLINLYKKHVQAGDPVYISVYFDQVHEQYVNDIQAIAKNFRLNLVQSGCNGACNLYKIELK